MPPPDKRIKLTVKSNELKEFREEIKKIGNITEQETHINISKNKDKCEDSLTDDHNSRLKKFIKQQIKLSERKIQQRLDVIEHKLNRLLERRLLLENENSTTEETLIDEGDGNDQIFEEFIDDDNEEIIIQGDSREVQDEFSNSLFPISDEETFDWFMSRLKDDSYREILVSKRWQLTRNCGMRSFNVSVKDFIRMHFELSVCIKYSVSGYGSRGTRKKKLDSQSLTKYVFDCFSKSQPGIHSFQEVSKAIVNYWGRTPDTFAKSGERAIKNNVKYEFN